MGKEYETLDVENTDKKKNWNLPLTIITVVLAVICLVSPLPAFSIFISSAACILSLTLFILCIIFRKKNKTIILAVINLIVTIMNALIIFTQYINLMNKRQ